MPTLTARLQACKECRQWGTHERIHTDTQKYVYIHLGVYIDIFFAVHIYVHIHTHCICVAGTRMALLKWISWSSPLMVILEEPKLWGHSGSTAGMFQSQTAIQLELMQFIKINKYRGNRVLHTCCLDLEIDPYQFSLLANIDTALLDLASRKLIKTKVYPGWERSGAS